MASVIWPIMAVCCAFCSAVCCGAVLDSSLRYAALSVSEQLSAAGGLSVLSALSEPLLQPISASAINASVFIGTSLVGCRERAASIWETVLRTACPRIAFHRSLASLAPACLLLLRFRLCLRLVLLLGLRRSA